MSLFVLVASITAGFLLLIFLLLKFRRYRQTTAFRRALLDEVNYIRFKAKLKPLWSVRFMDKLARRHSRSMAVRKLCDHSGIEKRAAILKDKMGFSEVAENCCIFPVIGYNVEVARVLIKSLLKLPDHRVNMLNKKFARTGMGVVVKWGQVYVTQIFTN